jgi:hypothetical protein
MVPGNPSAVLLSREEAAAFRTRAVDVGTPANGAPPEGLLARNVTDGVRYLGLDGVPALWTMPGSEVLVSGLARGRYTAQWRTFLGDVIEPARSIEVPARLVDGEIADAGTPAPAKSK